MKAIIKKPAKTGTVRAIASKSMAHRMMITQALSETDSTVICGDTSEDIEATKRCLEALSSEDEVKQLYCGESGSTLRFMLPIAAVLGLECDFHMEGRLPQRPLSPLYEEMMTNGCSMSEQGENPLHLSGRLSGGTYTIPGNISSQYITGLLFALPLAEEDSRINITGRLESSPYIDLTLQALDAAGIKVVSDDKGFGVPGGQKYRLSGEHHIEGDWSNAAFWLCMSAMTDGSICCSGLDMNSRQGDRRILDVLESMGGKAVCEDNAVRISAPEGLKGAVIDASEIPDLVPVIAATAVSAKGQTVIENAGRLRLKESDRLKSVSTVLAELGADIAELTDGLVINGSGSIRGGSIDSFGDHRIAMMAATAACISSGEITILGAEAVNKSYPGFYRDYRALGGEIDID